MKKLSLDLSSLRVESFETDVERQSLRGTVRGNAQSDCCTFSCAGTCGILPPSAIEPAKPSAACAGETDDYTGCLPCCV